MMGEIFPNQLVGHFRLLHAAGRIETRNRELT